jgi:hypothetical protein
VKTPTKLTYDGLDQAYDFFNKQLYVKGKLRSLGSKVQTTDTRTVALPPKIKDDVYTTAQYQAWRAMVLRRAGYRCEAIDQHGHRCTRARPEHRLYADHVVELKDNGSLLDINNGQCLCASHHQVKTVAVRIQRHQAQW